MWTDPERFAARYGPTGATVGTVRFDLRPGGERTVAMTVQTPSGERSMWFTGEHVEIDEPRLLVYSEAMTDRDGATPQSPVTTVRLELADEAGARRSAAWLGATRSSLGPWRASARVAVLGVCVGEAPEDH